MTRRPLVLVSAEAEWQAVRDLLQPRALQASPLGPFFHARLGIRPVTLFHGGWGKIAAAASSQYVLDRFQPSVLINLGTCGGFLGRVERGTVLLVTETAVYDILEQMGEPEQALAAFTTRLDLSWLPRPFPHPVRPARLVSADRDLLPADIPALVTRYEAVAADWESGAIAWVAARNGVRCLILRGVTDLVGPAGGEAYGNPALFQANTRAIMARLIDELPDWLA